MPTGTFTPTHTWSRPIWNLHMLYLLRLIISQAYRDSQDLTPGPSKGKHGKHVSSYNQT